jgi:peptidoglycan/LPS O-acetylase OafA/YrhL
MPGGYVGVSVFFTLSGYLITSLALIEHDRSGTVDAPAFYGRRVRRLLPASLLCLVAVVVMAWRGLFLDDSGLRLDLWGALLQVANWVDLASGESYADLLAGGSASGSPLAHYWSLAIEEQFYWVWPLALLLLLRLRPGRRGLAFAVLILAGVAAAPLIAWGFGPDAAYWATPARLGEILLGAGLAYVLHHRRRRLPQVVSLGAPIGLVVIIWAATTWPSGRGPAYEGWLPVFALASVGLILGLQVRSPLRRLLAWRPLVALGVISYGVYLFHWPIFLAINERTGWSIGVLFTVRVLVTLVVAVLSFVLLERPVRAARLTMPATLRVGFGGVVAVALVIATVPIGRHLATSSVAEGAAIDRSQLAVATTAGPTPSTAASAPTTTTPAVAATVPVLPTGLSRPVRLLVVGDSTAMSTGDGLVEWARQHPDVAEVRVVASPGCGLVRGGQEVDEVAKLATACADLLEHELPEAVASTAPDAVLVMVTVTDVVDRVWDEVEGPIVASDQRYVDRLTAEYRLTTQWLLDQGVHKVLWVAPPAPDLPATGSMTRVVDPVIRDRYRGCLATIEAAFPGRAVVLDLAGWLAAQPDPPERYDGLHFSKSGAEQVAARYLGPLAVAAAVS